MKIIKRLPQTMKDIFGDCSINLVFFGMPKKLIFDHVIINLWYTILNETAKFTIFKMTTLY